MERELLPGTGGIVKQRNTYVHHHMESVRARGFAIHHITSDVFIVVDHYANIEIVTSVAVGYVQ